MARLAAPRTTPVLTLLGQLLGLLVLAAFLAACVYRWISMKNRNFAC